MSLLSHHHIQKIILGYHIVAFFCVSSIIVHAQANTQTDPTKNLEIQIEQRRVEIENLEKEIAKDREEINKLGTQQKTLDGEIKLLDVTRTKLNKEISVTTNRIAITDAELTELGDSIVEKERKKERALQTISETVRLLQQYDDQTFIESFLSSTSLSDAWEDIDMVRSLQGALKEHIASITTIKNDLEEKRSQTAIKRTQLAEQKATLADQKSVVDYTTKEKNNLLNAAKNKESQYQKLLAEKLATKEAFEQELLQFEAEIRFIKDSSAIPVPRPGMLQWPLSSVRITQQFGDTAFSRANAGVYNGKGHNGIDLGAPIGTPIIAAGDGVVEATGDTDTVCPGASYGKWILIRHKNGLSSLYAHLSVIKVSSGDSISVGQTIGYIGMTGYTTGPHLHFTVYATEGVKVMDRQSKVCGGSYRMPIADLRAYLNPILYLPR